VRQIISKSLAYDEVIDIFKAAGMTRPDISILSDEFLADVKHLPHRNLALEVLRKLLGDETLCTIARELVDAVRRNVTIDWAVKESVRARLRLLVKKILKRYGYPPDKQAAAMETVLKQAELLASDWAA
jgi:type I site-specific restriction-modification system R (restriction) subunit